MKKITNLAKLSHRFADTCCYTNIKSNILSNARCGLVLRDAPQKQTPVVRKRREPCCTVGRNDLNQCQKCKQISDSLWTAHTNSGMWIDDNALTWFESQQDARRQKQIIFEEYMQREDAPIVTYTPQGIKFTPPPFVPKERKHRLDPKKFKRISPEFLRLLQHHYDFLQKCGQFEMEPEHELESPLLSTNNDQKSIKRPSSYLKHLKKYNTKPTHKSDTPLLVASSNTSFAKRNYIRKKRSSSTIRIKAGKDERRSSITRLKTSYTYYPNPTSISNFSPVNEDDATSNWQRGGRKVFNYYRNSNSRSLKAAYQSASSTTNAPTLRNTSCASTKVILAKPIPEKSRNLKQDVYTKAMASNSLCRRTALLSTSSNAAGSVVHKCRYQQGYAPVSSTSTSSNAAGSVVHKCRYQQGYAPVSSTRLLRKTKPVREIHERKEIRQNESVVNKKNSRIPLNESYVLAIVDNPFEPSDVNLDISKSESTLKADDSDFYLRDPFEVPNTSKDNQIETVNKEYTIPTTTAMLAILGGNSFKSSYCQNHQKDVHFFEPKKNKSRLKVIDSNTSMPTSSCYLLHSAGDPFEIAKPKRPPNYTFRHLGTNTTNPKSFTAAYSYTSFAPSTTSVHTQTSQCSNKMTQTLLIGEESVQSSSYLDELSPTSSGMCINGISAGSDEHIIVKPNPLATKRPNHRYPRI